MENQKENLIEEANLNEIPKPKPIVETYASDASLAMRSGDGGTIRNLIQEQEEKEEEIKEQSPQSRKNQILMVSSIALILIAITAVFLWAMFREKNSTVPIALQFVPLIFTDQNKTLEIGGLKKEQITQTVLNELKATEMKRDAIEGIYLTNNTKPVGLREFVSLIKGNLLSEKIPFVSDVFLMGVFNNETAVDSSKSKEFFVLLKTRSFPDIFDGMKDWEDKMFSDLAPFFDININSETKYLVTKDFEDGFIQNQNAKILRDNDGKIVLMYVFTTNTSVVITNSEDAVREIILRLASSQIKK